MPQTLDNGIVVPINSDGYNLTGDLATMGGKTNAATVCVNQAARDALTVFTGRLCARLDTGALEMYNGTAWVPVNPGAGTSYTLASPSGFTVAGTCYVTPMSNGTHRVEVDLSIGRTGTSFALTGATTPQSLGTVLPAAAIGASNTKGFGTYLNGAGSGPIPVQLNVVPSTGGLEIRSQSAVTWIVGAACFANCTYYI